MTNIKVEMLSINDFDHVCRTCSSHVDLKPLFDNIETLSMLESLTQMQFSRSDELPDKICLNCLTNITDCFNFINNCKIADERYRKCLSDNNERIENLVIKTDVLHSSFEIKDEEPPIETETIAQIDLIDETEEPKINDNIKEIKLNQSEFYILQWGTGADVQENKNFHVGKINSPNEQDLLEQQALRRIQAAERVRRLRAKHIDDTHKLAEIKNKMTRFNNNNNNEQGMNLIDENSHRIRAKLTLPHEEHNYILRRNFEAPERIALRRVLAREQMRKYRSKLTADETALHRAEATDRMRQYRSKLCTEDQQQEQQQQQLMTRSLLRGSFSPKLQIPLRLSEMAETLLNPIDPLQMPQQENEIFPRFSLRPTRIPQVKKQCFEVRTNENQVTKLRTWKRQKESTDEVTIRLAKTALQMKRIHSLLKEPGQVEESALQRAKANGQLRQYRPMLRKNKTIPVPTVQNSK